MDSPRALPPGLDALLRRLGDPEPRVGSHSMELLRCVLANVPDYIAMIAPDGTLVFVNRLRDGSRLESAVGRSVYEFAAPAHVAAYRAAVQRVVRTGQPDQLEQEARLSDGSPAWFETRLQPVRDGGDVIAVLLIATDVSARKRAERALRESEERLRQAQKLEAVGQLTAGIAHNFNNMLMGILPNLELALRAAPPSVAPLLQNAERAGQRAADLVRNLMTYAGRNRPAARRDESIGLVVERAVTICRTTFDRRIAFEVRCDPRARGRVDAAQLEQALLNLLINARDAVLDGGREDPCIVVEVDVLAPGAEELARAGEAQPAPQADVVRIRISDNGIGMDAATLARVYEPFFTTKPVGRGTGLGLATTHSIAREHGGWMACASRPGEGTTFSMFLPGAGGPAGDEPSLASPSFAGGAETILVVDDEPTIRQVVHLMLADAGYAVRLADSGRAALELLADAAVASAVRVILLDVSMPGITREELRSRLRAVAPRARVVYFTGYAFEATDPDDAVLEKPVTQARLLGTIRAILDGA